MKPAQMPLEYKGMGYQQASREAMRLIARKGWFQSWERLAALREIMLRERCAERNVKPNATDTLQAHK